MNKAMLRNDQGKCKLCDLIHFHQPGCPGDVIERTKFYLETVRRCDPTCSYDCNINHNRLNEFNTEEEACQFIRETPEAWHRNRYDLYGTYRCEASELVTKVQDTVWQEVLTKDLTESQNRVQEDTAMRGKRALARLEREKKDLIPEAYDRRRNGIKEKYGI